MSIAGVVVRIVGRRHAATPEVFIGTDCDEPGCTVTGTLHEHRPRHMAYRIALAEGVVLHELAARTARTGDSWAAAIEQFGGGK